MEEHRADKSLGEVNEIPEGHVAVGQDMEGSVEVLYTEEGYTCNDCGEVFETEEERNGHMSSHSNE